MKYIIIALLFTSCATTKKTPSYPIKEILSKGDTLVTEETRIYRITTNSDTTFIIR